MFQYEFFSIWNFLPHLPPKTKLPTCFVRPNEIQWIRSSYWSEHCLECGEPLCYQTCPNFKARGDGRCRLFKYGIYDSPYFHDAFYHAQIKYRKWGKLETTIYPGSFSPEKALLFHDQWKKKSLSKCRLIHLGSYGLKKFPIADRQKFDSMKYGISNKEDADNRQNTHSFLLQVYSYEQKPFCLFLDITDDAALSYRESITIYPGYNQQCLDIRSVFPQKGRLRTKIYPADNAEPELVFLFCECVQLKPEVFPVSYPPISPVHAPKVKCVAWDLDNTLWDGIVIESDPHLLTLRPGIRDIMEELDRRGILQIVVSKNNSEDVLPILKNLEIDHLFVQIYANWNSKSSNLKQAAHQLNIGIDSFAIIDDSAYERNEVVYALPCVRTYSDQNIDQLLLAHDEFTVPVTDESTQRRIMYQTEAARQLASQTTDTDNLGFLKSCQLTAFLSKPNSEQEILRSFELLHRTNQLNLSGSKYNLQTFQKHLSSTSNHCLILKCHDRFGSYGQVAYLEAIYQPDIHCLKICEFAMSCRIAGKYVEPALMAELFHHYGDSITKVELCGMKTDRNNLLVESFLKCGFIDVSSGEEIHLVCSDSNNLLSTDITTIISNLEH